MITAVGLSLTMTHGTGYIRKEMVSIEVAGHAPPECRWRVTAVAVRLGGSCTSIVARFSVWIGAVYAEAGHSGVRYA